MISVIVPVYNVRDYIERCVNSITHQTYGNLEILLVDDGSTDGSSEICDKLSRDDDRIIVIHKENGGLSSARNLAIDKARGEYLFFVDSDDYILPGIIEKLYNACINYKAEISCCGYISGKKEYYSSGKTEIINSIEATKRLFICDGIDANAVCKLYDARLFESLRYPLCAYEVVPVTYKTFLKSNRIVLLGVPGYYIEKREGSITRSKFGYNNLLYVRMAFDEYEIVKDKYYDLAPYAYTFFHNALISMREKAELDDKCKNTKEFAELINIYRREKNNIYRNQQITRRKKLIVILMDLGLYRIVYRLYRLLF